MDDPEIIIRIAVPADVKYVYNIIEEMERSATAPKEFVTLKKIFKMAENRGLLHFAIQGHSEPAKQ